VSELLLNPVVPTLSRRFFDGQVRQRGPVVDVQFEQAVRETAYFLWEQDGRPLGREKEYWFRALERTLRERNANAEIAEHPEEFRRAESTGLRPSLFGRSHC
jgi:hypothetical protein